jgi:hypothetical protein
MGEIASDYSVQFIDLNKLSGFNLQTIPTFTDVDLLHPNSIGAAVIANVVSNGFITSNNKGGSNVFTSILTVKANDAQKVVIGAPTGGGTIRLEADGFTDSFIRSNGNTELYGGNFITSGNVTGKDGFFTRDGVAIVEILGLDGTGGVVGTDTNHDLILRRSNIEKARLTTTGVIVTGVVTTSGYTVATLPTGVVGMTAYVTNATAPTYLATVVGGGSVVTPVFFNGTNWVCH